MNTAPATTDVVEVPADLYPFYVAFIEKFEVIDGRSHTVRSEEDFKAWWPTLSDEVRQDFEHKYRIGYEAALVEQDEGLKQGRIDDAAAQQHTAVQDVMTEKESAGTYQLSPEKREEVWKKYQDFLLALYTEKFPMNRDASVKMRELFPLMRAAFVGDHKERISINDEYCYWIPMMMEALPTEERRIEDPLQWSRVEISFGEPQYQRLIELLQAF